jgi:photosystem II stability/assembly factor-like uncharacterized protein
MTPSPTLDLTPSRTPTLLPTATPFSTSTPPPCSLKEDLERFKLPALTPGEEITLTQIKMLSLQKGWAVGHQGEGPDHILSTADGGKTWTDISPPRLYSPAQGQPPKALGAFWDQQRAWVIYQKPAGPFQKAQVIWRTEDGGKNWEMSCPLALTGLEIDFIPGFFAFSDPNHGWLLVHLGYSMNHDYSHLFATQDGGETWERLLDPQDAGLQSLHNTGMAFADAQFGWVSKDNLGVLAGAFYEETTDGGHTWERAFLPAPDELDWNQKPSLCRLSSPRFLNPQSAALIVRCKTFQESGFGDWAHTYAYTTQDRGKTWKHTRFDAPVKNLLFINQNTGWALGRDIYRTSDGGLTWVKVKQVTWDGQFSFVDTQNGWAVARDEDEIALVFTEDGGNSWQIITPYLEDHSSR